MRHGLAWMLLFFGVGCAEEKVVPLQPVDDVFLNSVDDPEWIAEHFEEQEAGDLVVYDVTIPENGVLSLSLIDRGDCLFTTEGEVEVGTTRVAFQFWKIMGKDILNEHVNYMLDSEEEELFKKTFPDFEERCLLNMKSVRQELTKVVEGNTGNYLARGTSSWVSNAIPYPEYKELGARVSRGPVMVNGHYQAKPGKAFIAFLWAWQKSMTTRIDELILDENNRLTAIDAKGEPVSGNDFESPLWALVLKFEPKEIR